MEKKFIEIFTGLKRNFGFAKIEKGYTDPETGKLQLKPGDYGWSSRPIEEKDYLEHLSGKKSIGVQPCNDEGMAKFGAIDIDHYKNFSPKKYLDTIKEHSIPVIPCRSKSGGLHIYIFLKEPVKATIIRNFLSTLLFTFGLKAKTEIFPKQTELGEDDNGKLQNGHFINLPYYKKTERCALNFDGTEFTFDQFIEVINTNLKSREELENFSLAHIKTVLQGGAEEFNEGPPCLQAITRACQNGGKLNDDRDRFLYNYMVFAKKKYYDNWEDKVKQAAREYFIYDQKWDDNYVDFKIKGWKKETKGHLCNEEPIVNFCMKSECIKRKFGIASDRRKAFPALSGLQKINYRPDPEYTFNVACPDGEKVKQVHAKSIEYLTDQRKIRNIIGVAANFVPPMQKGNIYQEIIDNLFNSQLDDIEPPEETSPEGQLFNYMKEYINGPKAETNIAFKSGSTLWEDEYAYFKFEPFFDTLKNKEWKIKTQQTAHMIKTNKKILGEFGPKRFPKKKEEKESNDPLQVIKVRTDKFKEEEIEDELIDIKGTDNLI